MRKKKKRWVMPLVTGLLAVILYAGLFGKKSVELLNDNPPLIDLDAAIQEADFGKNGNTDQDIGDSSQENPGGNNGEDSSSGQDVGRTHVIRVRDEEITYESLPYRTMDTLKRKLKQVYHSGDDIRLVDDYAEYHAYVQVLTMLEELQAEGYVISAD